MKRIVARFQTVEWQCENFAEWTQNANWFTPLKSASKAIKVPWTISNIIEYLYAAVSSSILNISYFRNYLVSREVSTLSYYKFSQSPIFHPLGIRGESIEPVY